MQIKNQLCTFQLSVGEVVTVDRVGDLRSALRSELLVASVNRSEPVTASYLNAHIYLLSVQEFFPISVDT